MDKLFGASRFRFADYEPRKSLNDSSGVLAMALAGIEMHEKRPSLYSAAIHLDTAKLGTMLDGMDSPEGFCRTLYESELSTFLVLVEGSWVYLYLAAEQNLTADETLRRISSSKAVQAQARRWHLKKSVDIEVIKAFFAVYRAMAGEKVDLVEKKAKSEAKKVKEKAAKAAKAEKTAKVAAAKAEKKAAAPKKKETAAKKKKSSK
jgi:hypothetical protein